MSLDVFAERTSLGPTRGGKRHRQTSFVVKVIAGERRGPGLAMARTEKLLMGEVARSRGASSRTVGDAGANAVGVLSRRIVAVGTSDTPARALTLLRGCRQESEGGWEVDVS